MATTIKRIIESIPNDYMGNTRTIFEDENGHEVYTFGKVFEGQSYEGSITTDRQGKLQFKKPPKEGFAPAPAPAPAATAPSTGGLVPPPPTQTASSSTQQFVTAVDKFVAAVNQLNMVLDGLNNNQITDADIDKVQEFLEG